MTKITSSMISSLLIGVFLLAGKPAFALDKVTVTLPSKSFQFIIFPLAKERGYMKDVVVMASTPGLQAVLAGEMDFTGSGSSALVAVAQSNAPLKTVLAVNDQVLQWLMVRPQYSALKELKNKKVAVTGVAAVATFMLKKVASKYGLDANKDLAFLALPQERSWQVIKPGGIMVTLIGFSPSSMETAAARGVRAEMIGQRPDVEQLRSLATLIDAGQIKPIVNAVLPISSIGEAQDRVQTGHTRGKIVMRMDLDGD